MCDECDCEDCVYHGQGHNCCRVDANATNVPNNVDDVGFLREVGTWANSYPLFLTYRQPSLAHLSPNPILEPKHYPKL